MAASALTGLQGSVHRCVDMLALRADLAKQQVASACRSGRYLSRSNCPSRPIRLRPSVRRRRLNHRLAAPARSVAAQVTGSPTSAGPTAPWISQESKGSTKEVSSLYPVRALRPEPKPQNHQFGFDTPYEPIPSGQRTPSAHAGPGRPGAGRGGLRPVRRGLAADCTGQSRTRPAAQRPCRPPPPADLGGLKANLDERRGTSRAANLSCIGISTNAAPARMSGIDYP